MFNEVLKHLASLSPLVSFDQVFAFTRKHPPTNNRSWNSRQKIQLIVRWVCMVALVQNKS